MTCAELPLFRAVTVLGLAALPACSPTQLAWYGHTPDRAQVIEVRQRGGVQWLVTGGRTSKTYRAIAVDDLAFDPQGRRLAFAAQVQVHPESWRVVADFVEGPAWEGIAGLRFGPHGARLVYAGLDHGHWSVIVDGARGPSFEAVDVDSIAFSPDGWRVAYTAQEGVCARVVVDGRLSACFGRIVGLAVADDASRDLLAFADRGDGSDAHVLLGGTPVYDARHATSFSVDPTVPRWALVVASPDGMRLVLDGSEQEAFDVIGHVIWAPDGRTVAYTARRFSAWFVVMGDRPGEPHAEVEDPVFAANGSHVGYVARDPGRSVVAIDGKVVWQSEAPATALALSNDGSRRGWIYRDGQKAVIAVDDQRYPFDVAVEHTLCFSRDGRHWAALVGSLAGRRLYVTVDGRSSLPFDGEELFGDPGGGAEPRLSKWISAELELHLARRGGRS